MSRLFLRVYALFLVLVVCLSEDDISTNATTTPKPHIKSICSQCECISPTSKLMLVDCNSMNFEEMPKFTKDLKFNWGFEIEGNSLEEIVPFPKFENLTIISFKYNRITKIADSAFAGVTNLQKLDLSHNKLTGGSLTSDTLKGNYRLGLPYPLESLKNLDLSFNEIPKLSGGVFRHLTNLTTLDLSHNPFRDFSPKTAAAFTELIALETLDISYTELQRLPDHFFAELITLKNLDLSGNMFTIVPHEINFARSLRTLKLSDTNIDVIKEGSFGNSLDGLSDLHLDAIPTLHKIDDKAFGDLTGLKNLWLNDNPKLENIHPHAFYKSENVSVNLRNLYVQNSALKSIHIHSLNWESMTLVNLQGNPWNCDCKFEWVVKSYVPAIAMKNKDFTENIRCAEPEAVKGIKVTDDRVQTFTFICFNDDHARGYSFILIATIIVGCLLLVTGTIFFLYIIFRKTSSEGWIGENVKYSRANDEESASTILC